MKYLSTFIVLAVVLLGCNKESPKLLPTLTTKAIDSITNSSAVSGGIISSDGGSKITARGVCWDTTQGPTAVLPSKTSDGSGSGDFNSNLKQLINNRTYYVRAYATNSVGTAYGDEISFSTAFPVVGSAKSDSTDFLSRNGSKITFKKISWGYDYQQNWGIFVSYVWNEDWTYSWNIVLPTKGPPTESRVYNLQGDPAYITYRQYSYVYSANYYYTSSGGQLKVDVTNGQVSVSFTDVPMKDTSPLDAPFLLSGHLTCH